MVESLDFGSRAAAEQRLELPFDAHSAGERAGDRRLRRGCLERGSQVSHHVGRQRPTGILPPRQLDDPHARIIRGMSGDLGRRLGGQVFDERVMILLLGHHQPHGRSRGFGCEELRQRRADGLPPGGRRRRFRQGLGFSRSCPQRGLVPRLAPLVDPLRNFGHLPLDALAPRLPVVVAQSAELGQTSVQFGSLGEQLRFTRTNQPGIAALPAIERPKCLAPQPVRIGRLLQPAIVERQGACVCIGGQYAAVTRQNPTAVGRQRPGARDWPRGQGPKIAAARQFELHGAQQDQCAGQRHQAQQHLQPLSRGRHIGPTGGFGHQRLPIEVPVGGGHKG